MPIPIFENLLNILENEIALPITIDLISRQILNY